MMRRRPFARFLDRRVGLGLWRAVRVGFVAAVAGYVFVELIMLTAPEALLQISPNYASRDPLPGGTSSLGDMALMLGAMLSSRIIFPTIEEIWIRGIVFASLHRVFGWRGGSLILSYWIPALITTAIWVPLHETASPVHIVLRAFFSMLMCYVFFREGLLACIFSHIFHNTPGYLTRGAGAILGDRLHMRVDYALFFASILLALMWTNRIFREKRPVRFSMGIRMRIALAALLLLDILLPTEILLATTMLNTLTLLLLATLPLEPLYPDKTKAWPAPPPPPQPASSTSGSLSGRIARRPPGLRPLRRSPR
ncbi:MAG: CPBP family intramembrane glutamic endopeptidase [Elusimicrobiota bacterium]